MSEEPKAVEESKGDEHSIPDSVWDTARERFDSPAVGSFIVSWLVLNWQFIAILFMGKSTIEERIDALKAEHMNWGQMIGWPALAATVLVICLPWVNYVVSELRKKPRELKRISQAKSNLQIFDLQIEQLNKSTHLFQEREKRAAAVFRAAVNEVKELKAIRGGEIEQLEARKAALLTEIHELEKDFGGIYFLFLSHPDVRAGRSTAFARIPTSKKRVNEMVKAVVAHVEGVTSVTAHNTTGLSEADRERAEKEFRSVLYGFGKESKSKEEQILEHALIAAQIA